VALIFWLLFHQGKSGKQTSRQKVENKPQSKSDNKQTSKPPRKAGKQ
jgi:hypothetical protein